MLEEPRVEWTVAERAAEGLAGLELPGAGEAFAACWRVFPEGS